MNTRHDKEFERLVARHLDDGLTPEEGESLDRMVASDSKKAKRFAQAATRHYQLRLLFKYQDTQPVVAREKSHLSSWARPWLLIPALAACLAIAATIHFVGVPWNLRGENATATSQPNDEKRSPADAECVARLVQSSSDATWAPSSGPSDFLLRLYPGQTVELLSGLAEIKFASGAVVILHGPTVFTPTGADSATLVRGRVTGRAENGNFRVMTPSARVIDLGTEFGIAVDGKSNTDVVVFEGQVSVVPTDSPKKRVDAIYLDGGATARIDANGELATGVSIESDAFKRAIPERESETQDLVDKNRLSVIDIVNGGDGRGRTLAGALDPLTGSTDQRPWKHEQGPGRYYSNGKYHRVQRPGMVDGVFIPTHDGKDTQIDSQGHLADFPASLGGTWGPIWARRRGDGALPSTTGDFWGTGTLPFILRRIAAAQFGALGMHSNVGMTLDLHNCSEQYRDRFRALEGTLVNLDLAKETDPKGLQRVPVRTADFWMFVDGVLKYSRRNFGRDLKGKPFRVELAPTDRFLTLVATDGGNSISFDHVMLIDPILILNSE